LKGQFRDSCREQLYFCDPLTDDVVQTCRDVVPRIVDGGATRAQVVRVDDTHLVLVLEFASPVDADRVAQEVGGPWTRRHILPLLMRGPERSVSGVVAAGSG
jgi:hypothetical protein